MSGPWHELPPVVPPTWKSPPSRPPQDLGLPLRLRLRFSEQRPLPPSHGRGLLLPRPRAAPGSPGPLAALGGQGGELGTGHPGDSGQAPPPTYTHKGCPPSQHPSRRRPHALTLWRERTKRSPGWEDFSLRGVLGCTRCPHGGRRVIANRRWKPRAGELGRSEASGGQQGAPRTPAALGGPPPAPEPLIPPDPNGTAGPASAWSPRPGLNPSKRRKRPGSGAGNAAGRGVSCRKCKGSRRSDTDLVPDKSLR